MTSEEKLEQSEIVKNKGTKYFKVLTILNFMCLFKGILENFKADLCISK